MTPSLFRYLAREKQRQKEQVGELNEKHSMETGTLSGGLRGKEG
jgi:hypothetical protein